MAVTPYLRLQKPPFDSIPWDQAINGNMDILDSTIAQFLSVPGYTGTWVNATNYTSGQVVLDAISAIMWQCLVSHTSATTPTTFAQDRAAHPTYWLNTTTAPVAPVDQHNIGRNLLHNPLFNVAQRGAGPFTVSGLCTADRWQIGLVNGSMTANIQPMNDTSRAQIGDEVATSGLTGACVGTAGATDEIYFEQRIEGVRRTSGKTMTLSFYAAATSGTPRLGTMLVQLFGSGGSPSAAVVIPGQAVTLSTTYTRYSVTFAVPSTAGKTFGTTAGTDYLGVRLCMSAGATSGASYGSPGVQSYTLQLWGVQLEVGTIATPLEKPDPRYDLANCQRFYQTAQFYMAAYNTTGNGIFTNIYLSTAMRATPVVTVGSGTVTNASGPSVTALASPTNNVLLAQATVVATGQGFYLGTAVASADL